MNTNTNTSIKCVLCNGLCENEYGNNPHPLSKTGVCCNVCNIKVVDARILSSCFDEDDLKYSDSEDEDEDYECICECGGEFKCMGCECSECYDICIAKLPCDREGCTVVGWVVSPNTRLCNPHAKEYAKQLLQPKQDIYECNTCQEDFDRANPIWIAMGIKDSNYCLPCELAHEQPIECERCKGMFAPDDMCDDRCAPCYQNYVEWLEENDMDA
jgi:hypothetical protein